jgi:ATP/maltotriose-dependent transcriptional regulator MalT
LGIAALRNHIGIHEISLSEYSKGTKLVEEGLKIYQETGIQWGMATSYWALSSATLSSGKHDEARQHACEGLNIVLKYRIWRHAYFLLNVVAQIYLSEGETERTYEILAMMEKQRQKLGQVKNTWTILSKVNLDAELPPNLWAAVARGRARDYETALKEIIDDLSAELSVKQLSSVSSHPDLLDALSERELEILRLVANGMSNQQIADQMIIALGTVKTHVHNIYGKLGVESRTQAIARARDLSLI